MKETFPENPTEPDPLTTDERLTLLSARYRRFALYSLQLFTTPVSLARIADTVTELEYGVPADERRDERLQIYMALYHNHLPRLVEAGVLRYDQSDDTVALGPNHSDVVELLRETKERDLPEGTQLPVDRSVDVSR